MTLKFFLAVAGSTPTTKITFYLMIFFYLIAAIMFAATIVLFFKLKIKDVFVRLSNKVEDEGDVPVPANTVAVANNVEQMAQQQNMTALLDNKGRTVLLDEPAAAPAAPVQNAPRAPQNPNFRVLKSVINIDTNEVI